MTQHVRRIVTSALCGAFVAGCLATATQSVTAGADTGHRAERAHSAHVLNATDTAHLHYVKSTVTGPPRHTGPAPTKASPARSP